MAASPCWSIRPFSLHQRRRISCSGLEELLQTAGDPCDEGTLGDFSAGSLCWMGSERQTADVLTKESVRALLATRLRHGKLKLTWDPHYFAHKKSKAEKAAALAESTALPFPRHVMARTEGMMEDEGTPRTSMKHH